MAKQSEMTTPRSRQKGKPGKFWSQRSTHYDKLFWTKDEGYLDMLLHVGGFKSDDLVLDVGVGTGAVAKKINPHVKHVVGIDISESMLMRGYWDGISTLKWNICDALFSNNIFDKVVARMAFHHILDNLDMAIVRCYDLLKNGGRLIVAEGVPPSDDPHVVKWFSEMFRLKEERLTFTGTDLLEKLKKTGFRSVRMHEYIMRDFSIRNWLINSGLNLRVQKQIMKLHTSADRRVQEAYGMRYVDEDCLVNTRNVILVGRK